MKCDILCFALFFFVHGASGNTLFKYDVLDIIRNVSRNYLTSDLCRETLILYIENLGSTEDPWPWQMLDATSKILTGLMSLNFGELGEFRQCLSTKSKDGFIKGKYCLGILPFQISSNISKNDLTGFPKRIQDVNGSNSVSGEVGVTWAICLPSKCSDKDVGIILNQLGFNVVNCQTEDDLKKPLTAGATVTIVMLSLYALFLALSTVLDLYFRQTKSEHPNEIIIAFSTYSNGKKLFRMNKNPNEISCLNGIRFWSTIIVILVHTREAHGFSPLMNVKTFLQWPYSWLVISEGMSLTVDSFLFISGLLVVYAYGKSKKKSIKFNIFHFYIHRFLRLSPPYFAAILVTANLLKYMGSGPVWSNINQFEENCQKHWWTALLYIQNYVNQIFLCVPQSWYLCVDMQLYIIMPLFLLPLWKYPKVGISLTILAIIVSMLVPFCITFINETAVPWGGIDDYSQTPMFEDYLTAYYYKTYMRATPYFIGVLIGYVLVNIKPGEEINIGFSKWLMMFLWALCAVIGLACFMGGYNYLKSETFNKWENSFYLALRRPLWTLWLAWITFACVKGNGGVINWLLSFSIYQVLNKFTYSMYLLHFQLLMVFAYSMKTGVYFDEIRFVYDFCGIIMLSFGVSIIWVMAFESPVFIIEKAIFDFSRKKKSFQPKNENV